MADVRAIFCCECGTEVKARLTDGREVYPHRQDLASLPFWKCDSCGNTVGCHHKTKDRTRPLGCIPGPEMKKARGHIHAILDPLWKSGRFGRNTLYARLTVVLGREYHTAELRTLDEARAIYRAVQAITKDQQIVLPQNYEMLSPPDRKRVRDEYVRIQGGKCSHCKQNLSGKPDGSITSKTINKSLFPDTFFKYPIHLHHSHDSGMTIGAVHCECNAVLWQYHKE